MLVYMAGFVGKSSDLHRVRSVDRYMQARIQIGSNLGLNRIESNRKYSNCRSSIIGSTHIFLRNQKKKERETKKGTYEYTFGRERKASMQ